MVAETGEDMQDLEEPPSTFQVLEEVMASIQAKSLSNSLGQAIHLQQLVVVMMMALEVEDSVGIHSLP